MAEVNHKAYQNLTSPDSVNSDIAQSVQLQNRSSSSVVCWHPNSEGQL